MVDYIPLLTQELGMDTLEPTKPGVYVLPLEDNIEITITMLPQGYSLSAQIGASPAANREMFFSKALQANLFGQGTHGAILGLQEDGNVLTLSKAVEYNSDYREFKETLEDFISTIVFWRDEVRTHK